MPIDVSCPSCSRQYRVRDDAGGKQFRCKDCGEVVTVPAAGRQGEIGDFHPPAESYVAETPARDSTRSTPARPHRTPDPYRGADLALPPGIALMITGSLSLLIVLGSAAFIAMAVFMDPNAKPQPDAIALLVGMTAVEILIGGTFCGLIFAGGNSLRKCGSYGLAMTGAVLAVVSLIFGCPCTPLGFSGMGMACLNLPVGIWALIVLTNMDVREAFRR
jgi:hypothetical protein